MKKETTIQEFHSALTKPDNKIPEPLFRLLCLLTEIENPQQIAGVVNSHELLQWSGSPNVHKLNIAQESKT